MLTLGNEIVINHPRILMVVPCYPYPILGGLEKQAHELAVALQSDKVSVKALGVRFLDSHEACEQVNSVQVLRLAWPKNRYIRPFISAFALATTMIKIRRHYDIVHIHQHSWFGLCAIVLAKLLSKPCLTKLPNVGEYGIPGMRKMTLGWLRIRLLKISDGIVAMSEQSGRELADIGYPRQRIFWTSNGISIDRACHPVQRQNRSKALVRVVFIGRLMEQKGIIHLLYAWQQVLRLTSIPCVLEIWGDGPLAERIQKVCAELDIVDHVVHHGRVDRVRSKLADVDIFALPSLNEGNSNALLEAMAAGLPCVATRVGGTPLLVGEDGTPWLCNPGDTKEMADKLVELVEDVDMRMLTGIKMRDRIEKYFDIRQVAASYLNAYNCLAKGHRDKLSQCLATWPGRSPV